jgi:hypothetical protein
MQDLVALDSEMVPDFLLLDSMDALAKRKKKNAKRNATGKK